jgi:hypothetical protein
MAAVVERKRRRAAYWRERIGWIEFTRRGCELPRIVFSGDLEIVE